MFLDIVFLSIRWNTWDYLRRSSSFNDNAGWSAATLLKDNFIISIFEDFMPISNYYSRIFQILWKMPKFLAAVHSILFVNFDNNLQHCNLFFLGGGERCRVNGCFSWIYYYFDSSNLITWKFPSVPILLTKYLEFKLFKVNVNLFKVNFENRLQYLRPMFLSYRSQSVDFPYKSIDWFLYE